MCTCPPGVLQMHGKTMVHDIQGDLSGDPQKFFVALLTVGEANCPDQRMPTQCTNPSICYWQDGLTVCRCVV